MALQFEPLDALIDDALTLPITAQDGKQRMYRIASPSSIDGLKVQRITNLAARLLAGGEAIDTEMLNDEEELDLIGLCLGATDLAMQKDGVDWGWRRHAGLTAMFWIINDAETAQKYWEAKGDPKLLAGNREARRAKAKKSGSAGVKKTRKQVSTSGTSAPRATASAPKAAQT